MLYIQETIYTAQFLFLIDLVVMYEYVLGLPVHALLASVQGGYNLLLIGQ
jgi:hypothetical protein